MRIWYASHICLWLGSALCAADPAPAPSTPDAAAVTLDLGTAITVEVGTKCILTAQTGAKKVTWYAPKGVDIYALDGKRVAVWAKPGTYVLRAAVPSGDDVVAADVTLTVTGQLPRPPDPVDPVDPINPPQPVKSFKVFLIVESGTTLTAAQQSVVYGKTVEDYLNTACTGGKAGWRRRDKDAGGENDPATAALWASVKPEFQPPKNTATPAVAVAVNDKVTILPLSATPAEMVAVLKSYRGQ